MRQTTQSLVQDLLGVAQTETPRGIPNEPELPQTVHESTLAALLGIRRARLSELVRDGILRRVGPARFQLREAVNSYTADLRSKTSPMGRGRPTSSSPELDVEKLRLAKQQADKVELQNAAARGSLVPALEVEREWAGVLRDVRAAMLAVPSRVGSTLPHLSAHDVAAIENEIKAALEGLADGH